jgi:hypothetical protein
MGCHTLNHKSTRNDLLGLTILAFSHFVYGHSNQTLVIADIQGNCQVIDHNMVSGIITYKIDIGSPGMVKGQDGMILFDLMTHTEEGYGFRF